MENVTKQWCKAFRPMSIRKTRLQDVQLRLQKPSQLVPGQVVRITLRERVDATGFWVPTSALSPEGRGLWSVMVIAGNQAAARPVEVIEADGDRSYIRGTLQAGDRVIVKGAHRVVPGQQVRITN